MRLFVAVVPPADVLTDLGAAVDGARAVVPGLRWVPPERMHLTLAFLGEVEPGTLPDLTERLGRAAGRSTAAVLRVEGAGRFGGRVLWAGIQGDVPALTLLAQRCAAAARRAGLTVEERPYRAHLTLARSSRPVDLRPAVAAVAGHSGRPWRADEVALVRSRTGPQPAYETLVAWPLTGG